jgi:YVTN family beta-propeller protein
VAIILVAISEWRRSIQYWQGEGMKTTKNSLLRGGLLVGAMVLITSSVFHAQTILTTVTDPGANQPQGLAVNSASNKVYIANAGSHTVTVIDGATNTVSASLPIGTQVYLMATNPGTNKAHMSPRAMPSLLTCWENPECPSAKSEQD